MGFTEVLTIIFVVMKCLGKINWSWLVVLSPEIVALVVYALILFCVIRVSSNAEKRFWKGFKDGFNED